MYTQITNAIEVSVAPEYLEDQSRPEAGIYVWSYEVRIANRRDAPVQLVRRHWRIANALGQNLEVKGDGVIGTQPVIQPGETYAYSSYTNLGTPSGFMFGSYVMEEAGGPSLEVAIPPFSLDSPEQLALLH